MSVASAAILFVIAYLMVGVCTLVSDASFEGDGVITVLGWPGVWAAWLMHSIGR